MAKIDDKKREIAEDLYIRAGMTGRDIADQLGVTEQTVSRWKKGRNGEKSWDERKNEMQLTPMKVKELLIKEAANIANGTGSQIDADQLSKIVAAIDRLDRKINTRIVFDVLREFDNWFVEVNPQMAVELTKFHKMFLQHRISIETQ